MCRKLIKLNRRVLSYDWENAFLCLVVVFLLAAIPTVSTLLETRLIARLLAGRRAGGTFLPILALVGALFLVRLLRDFVTEKKECVDAALAANIEAGTYRDIFRKASRLRYEAFEDAATRDLLYRVEKMGEECGASAVSNTLSVLENCAGIAFLAVLIASVSPVCCAFLLLLEIPILLLAYRNGTANYAARRDATAAERREDYYKSLFLNEKSVCEMHIFDSFALWNGKWKDAFHTRRDIEFKGFLRYFLRMRAAVAVGSVCTVFLLLVMLASAEGDAYGASSAALLVAFTGNLISLLKKQTDELPYCLSELVKACRCGEDCERFFALPETDGAKKETGGQTGETRFFAPGQIVCENVRFRYPNTERYILNGVSCTFDLTKKYAIVGGNGAGKTTLVKLLTGLYRDYEGSIRIDGAELRNMDEVAIRGLYAVVFQDFARYSASVFDNLMFGKKQDEENQKKVRNALKAVGVWEEFAGQKDAEFTEIGLLGEGSVDVSTGQWQRIALARALIKNAPVTVLDEPASALDPIMESSFYRDMEKLFGGGTILISHRLASVQNVNEIFVLDGGKVAERGGHAELMGRNGLYRKMYESQRKWYVSEASVTSENCI